jgi:hypothetical protein
LAVALAVGCYGPAPRDLTELRVADGLYLEPSSGQPFSGAVVRAFPDDPDRVQVRGTLVDGTWHGELTVFHPNGRVRYLGSFEQGERCGPWTENADSLPSDNTYEDLVREIESLSIYPACTSTS